MAVKEGVRTNLPLNNIPTLYINYRAALCTTDRDHLQGKDAKIDGTDFQIATPGELNRVSKKVRQSLGLAPHRVTNNETAMDKSQTSWNGYNNLDYQLPDGAQYNVLIRK